MNTRGRPSSHQRLPSSIRGDFELPRRLGHRGELQCPIREKRPQFARGGPPEPCLDVSRGNSLVGWWRPPPAGRSFVGYAVSVPPASELVTAPRTVATSAASASASGTRRAWSSAL